MKDMVFWVNEARSILEGLKKDDKPSDRPKCEACGGDSDTVGQSVLHPDPRLLCWRCSEGEYQACVVVTLARGGF